MAQARYHSLLVIAIRPRKSTIRSLFLYFSRTPMLPFPMVGEIAPLSSPPLVPFPSFPPANLLVPARPAGGPPHLPSLHILSSSASGRHVRRATPLYPVPSVDCAYFPSPQGYAGSFALPTTHFPSPLCFHTPLPRSARGTNPFCHLFAHIDFYFHYFHALTNPFFRDPFLFTSMQNPRG